MKKIFILLLVFTVMMTAVPLGVFAGSFGSGLAVMASDVNLIKTGLRGQSLPFSDADFKTALRTADITSVTVTKLPSTDEGILMLGERKLGEGQTVRRKNLGSLVFIPASADVSEARFRFKVGGAADEEYECIMKFIDKVNYAPTSSVISDAASLTTQRGISLYGELEASDPEGDDLEFIIVSYPTLGALSLIDSADGYYKYTPKAENTGEDSFVYVVRDEYGNYSETVTVNLKINERMSEVVYADMLDSESYNAAVALTAAGIMGGTVIGDGTYFMPDKTVSRAEFVAMAMKAVGVRADSTLNETFFDDNDQIPKALVGYVATAQRCGIINGAFDGSSLNFRPNDAITRYEAAIIMANLKGMQDSSLEAFSEDADLSSIPIWARAHVGAMCKVGIFDTEAAISGARDSLTRGEVAEYLYKLSGVK